MRKIDPKLSVYLKRHVGSQHVSKSKPFPVKNYKDLIKKNAELAFLNKDYLLFFRGQSKEYINKTGASTFYPSIYRGAYVPQEEIRSRFINLYQASELLIKSFEDSKIQGYKDVKRKKYIQWSILQHYEICNTPLLDFTHSLRIASTFAQRNNKNRFGYVYVFAFPYITNRISINSEDDFVNIRLLSICPPKALRPYFQDGYLAGTEDISAEFDSKSELDFNNRLVAKFQIENNINFWGRGFSKIPDILLFPKKDSVAGLSETIKKDLSIIIDPGSISEFLKDWSELEHFILENAENIQMKTYSIRTAFLAIFSKFKLQKILLYQFDELRTFRNRLVHFMKESDITEISSNQKKLKKFKDSFFKQINEKQKDK